MFVCARNFLSRAKITLLLVDPEEDYLEYAATILQPSSGTCISCNLLCHFAVTPLIGVCDSVEAKKIQNGEDCLSALQGGLQVMLLYILLKKKLTRSKI